MSWDYDYYFLNGPGNVADGEQVMANFLRVREHTTGDTPIGMVMMFAGATAPANYLMLDGALVLRSTYPELYAAIGDTYGAGDGSTTFALPDMRGRAPVAPDGAAARLTANDTLGASGGAEKVALTATNNGPHTHDLTAPTVIPDDLGDTSAWLDTGASVGTQTYATASQGSGTAHQNMQPYLVMNFIIKAL